MAACYICGSEERPVMVKKNLSAGGWALFAVLVLFCIPLCWLPFVIDGCKEEEWKCPSCGVRRA
ncbi:MAG: LITAF-like zinc ribbon domain-containing protein [Holophagales bacterium]|nr:LITAF-like zinc ribbon domain-containing protein [Holophagales bacterium]